MPYLHQDKQQIQTNTSFQGIEKGTSLNLYHQFVVSDEPVRETLGMDMGDFEGNS
jgi:hypothetical protein